MVSRISVRSLVEFILRHGDIDNRRNAPTDEAMQVGSRIHRMIQARQGSEYMAEIPLKYEYDTEKCHVILDGRADGIIILTQSVTIDEIKTTYRDVAKMENPDPVHLAQAKCYAAIYLIQNNLPKISVRMTYVNQETETFRYFHTHYEAEEIVYWFKDLCAEHAKWIDMEASWKEIRQKSIQNLQFPYPYRPGQKELVTHVYNTIYHEKKLFIEAPTGTGKTLSTLFPAIKSVGVGHGDKIFYLTARTIARTVAEEAAAVLKDHGLKYKNITLTAKEKICFLKNREGGEVECNPHACPYAKGHFDRVNEALFELVSKEDVYTREVIEDYAERYQVCPFEFGLDASLFADLIIGDYNYVFDPQAYLRRFFADPTNNGDYLFLVDEAHNLVDRAREMYSAVLVKEDLLICKRACKDSQPHIAKLIDKCNSEMLELKRSYVPGGGNVFNSASNPFENNKFDKTSYGPCVISGIDALIMRVERLHSKINEYLSDNNDGEGHEEILELFFTLSTFLNIFDLLDDNYVIYTDFDATGDFFVKLFCVDPSRNLKGCMAKARSSVLFSATLLPIQYYKSLLGGEKEDYEVYAQSVFDSKQRLLLQAGDVSSKYSSRGRQQYVRIAEYIHEISIRKKGNYMVFAPSYNFMYDVYEAYMDEFYDEESEEVICQSGQMREAEKEEFLARFRGGENDTMTPSLGIMQNEGGENDTITPSLGIKGGWGEIKFDIDVEDKNLIGFCVLGGIFSEGIDLKEDALIGVIVIGTGLPQIGGERDLLKNFHDHRGQNGFDFAYRYPGMNRVQQAAGRLIRTESDRGIIALLDDRYSQYANRRLFPREWDDVRVVNINNVGELVDQFWNMN